MARRPLTGWQLAHNKQPVRGTSMKDIRRRRARRLEREALRSLARYGREERKR